jgi:hypothetical protein
MVFTKHIYKKGFAQLDNKHPYDFMPFQVILYYHFDGKIWVHVAKRNVSALNFAFGVNANYICALK